MSRAEAKRMAEDLERQAERQTLGLDPIIPRDGGGTVAELLAWWLKRYSKPSPSHARNEYTIEAHFPGSDLGRMRLADVRPGHVEDFLQSKAEGYAPQTINHLRRYLVSAFARALETGRWVGANPARQTKPRKVPRHPGDYLRVEEVAPLLHALDEQWRPLFATAIYTGIRKGELLALRKTDVDLKNRRIIVARTNTRETTKGGRAGAVPIAAELVPYLEAAIAASPSPLLFPAEGGKARRSDVKLHGVLRRAMGRAGIATGYVHVCRRKGCGFSEEAKDADPRRCPNHGTPGPKLWPKAQVRPLRFHELRHTTGSLLVMAGASLVSVQRILRHSDIRITAEVYAHLAPDFLTREADLLKLGADAPELLEPMRAAVNAAEQAPTGPQRAEGKQEAPESRGISPELPRASTARSRGLEPLTSGVTGGVAARPQLSADVCGSGFRGVGGGGKRPGFRGGPPESAIRAPTGPQGARGAGLRLLPAASMLLSVREVARRLGVHPSTVYGLCERGELAHVRVSNAIRVRREDFNAFLTRAEPESP